MSIEDFEKNQREENESLEIAIKILEKELTEMAYAVIQTEDQIKEIDETISEFGIEGEEGEKRLKVKSRLEEEYTELLKKYNEEKDRFGQLCSIKSKTEEMKRVLNNFSSDTVN